MTEGVHANFFRQGRHCDIILAQYLDPGVREQFDQRVDEAAGIVLNTAGLGHAWHPDVKMG